MSWQGTAKYEAFARDNYVPERVLRAVQLARDFDFELSTQPETGRLASALASGVVNGLIGETGTGTGVGLAWMHATAPSTTQLISIELHAERAAATAELFSDCPNVTVLQGDAHELAGYGPFDLLVLDTGVGPGPMNFVDVDPVAQLKPNGLIFNDDQWPMTHWPPVTFDGNDCVVRPHWLDHPEVFTTEVQVADGYGVLLSRRRPPLR